MKPDTKPFKLDEIPEAQWAIEVGGLTISEIEGEGRQAATYTDQ
jgi:nitrogen regulatory protein PII